MIQRIQTVYILLATLCSFLMFFFPVWQTNVSTSGMDEIGAGSHLLLLPVAAIGVLVFAIDIFLFKNRKWQIRLCKAGMVLTILFMIMALIFIQQEHNLMNTETLKSFQAGAVLPVVSVFSSMLAIKNIKKDEAIVRDMDRLR